MNTVGKIAMALVVSGAMLSVAQPALAAGATVYHDNYNDADCFDYPDWGVTICWARKGVWHQVQTPSNNTIYSFKGTFSRTYIDNATGSEILTEGGARKQFFLFKEDDPHVLSEAFTSDFCFMGFGATRSSEFHFANGKVTRSNDEYSLEPC